MMAPDLAYTHHGCLRVRQNGGSHTVESTFGRSLRERAIEIHNRNAWKTQGPGGQSLARALRVPGQRDPANLRVEITSVAKGSGPGELVYTLETDEISGVFARDSEGTERRLFHTADFRTRHLDMCADGSEVAFSMYHRGGTVSLAVLKASTSELTEITDGDSVDVGARWVPGSGRRLVYHSAGVGRTAGGQLAEYSAFSIQQIDLDTGIISCLEQDEKFDLLWPHIAADGSLYYIRKPKGLTAEMPSPFMVVLGICYIPFRILWALGAAVNRFVYKNTGQLLYATKQTAVAKAARCPSTWLLMRKNGEAAAETIAKGAMVFDLCRDGSLMYSDGIDVYRTDAVGERPAKVLEDVQLETLSAL
jgi:hypothetical protein